MPRIIQFLHPSVEATPLLPSETIINWNNHDSHRRKFILSEGEYLNEKQQLICEDLVFWGEWEPQSKIISTRRGNSKPPKFINIPFIDPKVADRYHTTDPNVFGNVFRYIICMQRAFHRVLVDMPVGSIVLFGSSINRQFCLDTVFVVSGRQINYTLKTINKIIEHSLKGQYYHATIYPIVNNANVTVQIEDDSCRLPTNHHCTYYEGVKFSERSEFGGMYSFVPCKIYNQKSQLSSLFNQPTIQLDIFKGTQTQGITHKDLSLVEIEQYWSEIRRQIAKQDLLEAVSFKNPPLKL